MTSLHWWEQKEIHHVLGMSDIVEPYHPLCFTSGHGWNVSLIPVWFLSEITSLLGLNYYFPSLLLFTNMCHTH